MNYHFLCVYFQILCIEAIKQVNVVNTRTNILHIHGCHTRTDHKENQLLLMYFTSWIDLLIKTLSCKAKVKKPKKLCKVAWRHATSLLGGECLIPQMSHFFLFFLHIHPYPSLHKPFINTIFMNIFGFTLLFSNSFIFKYFERICGKH